MSASHRSLEIGVALRPAPGEWVSGDAVVSVPTRRGWLVALIDGLGHGPAAAEVARRAAACFEQERDLTLPELFEAAHRGLADTRGVVASAVAFDERASSIDFAGAGNVLGRFLHVEENRFSHVRARVGPGVLGGVFRRVVPERFPFGTGDLFLLHSDGVRTQFDALAVVRLPAQAAAEAILALAARDSDDASCVVLRHRGHLADSLP